MRENVAKDYFNYTYDPGSARNRKLNSGEKLANKNTSRFKCLTFYCIM